MTVGPDYTAPDTKVPDAWTREIMADVSSPINGSQLWWRKFNDSTLTQLVDRARKANPNINIARKRITESWHQRGVLSGAFAPHAEFAGRAETGILGYSEDGVDVDPGYGHYNIAQLQYGWELDVFGKIKRTVEAAEGEYEAKIEGWRDAMAFISGEVAITYIGYRTLQQRVAVAEEGYANFVAIESKIAQRLELGVTSRLEMSEATARLKTSEAQLPRLRQELEIMGNRLSQLTAIPPREMKTLLSRSNKIPTPPNSIAVGVPADLLRSRPDIRRAERKMAAQTARIGVAEAFLYPEFSISGALTYEFLRKGVTTALLDRVLGIGANMKWRIFNGCKDCHRIKENEALLDQAIGQYRKEVLKAMTEVEDAMARLHYTKRRLKILQDGRSSHRQTAHLMEDAYLADQVDLRRLLNSQTDYIATLDEEKASEGRRAAHAVRLYRALGGGELAGVPSEKHYKVLSEKGFWSFVD